MYFYNEVHEVNFLKMLELYPVGHRDPEYRVACYVIAHPEIYAKATRQNWEFVFDDWMTEEDFSISFRYLINAAFHLFSGGSHPFNLMDGLCSWDMANYQVFMQAVEIRKGFA